MSMADTEAEQNVTPIICSPTGRGVSDTRAPPNTEEDEIIICPWIDDLEIRSEEGAPVVPRTESQTKIRNVTIRRKQNSSVGSGTDGGNSDIGDLADFSADEEESQVEQFSGCRIPGCQSEGRIEYMEWDSDEISDSEDSEWEDPDERENRLWVERYNYDLIEGMTLMTYTPPTRKNRRRRYEDKVKCTGIKLWYY